MRVIVKYIDPTITTHEDDMPDPITLHADRPIKIEKNIPIPAYNNKYPWAGMEIGDSFFVSGATMKGVGGGLYSCGRRAGFKITVRSVDGGVRVWRTE